MMNSFVDIWLIFNKNIDAIFNLTSIKFSGNNIGVNKYFLIIVIIYFFVEILQIKFNLKSYFFKQHTCIRCMLYYILIFLILFYGVFDESTFIYFQF